MKIVLVAPGLIPIPPTGYGAVESIITDYKWAFEKLGHEVFVVNERDYETSIQKTNSFCADFVWIHDDRKSLVIEKFIAKNIALTSHDPTMFCKNNPLIKHFARGNHKIGCLSQAHIDQFIEAGVSQDRLFLCPNGARADLILFNEQPKYHDTAICLGVISKRKQQHFLSKQMNVRFAGKFTYFDPIPNPSLLKNRWLGEWDKKNVWENLTEYEALILISKAEAAPLVVMEALMAGLPVIVSEAAAANLPDSPFVLKLPDKECSNWFVLKVRIENFFKEKKWDRKAVRLYAIHNLDWQKLARNVLKNLQLG